MKLGDNSLGSAGVEVELDAAERYHIDYEIAFPEGEEPAMGRVAAFVPGRFVKILNHAIAENILPLLLKENPRAVCVLTKCWAYKDSITEAAENRRSQPTAVTPPADPHSLASEAHRFVLERYEQQRARAVVLGKYLPLAEVA